MEPAFQIVERRRVSNRQTGLWNVDRRRAKSEASRTILLARGIDARSDAEGGKAKVIDQRRVEDARKADQALICPRCARHAS